VFTRYPDLAPPIGHEEYCEALGIAETVVRWAVRKLVTIASFTYTDAKVTGTVRGKEKA
jgi:hypothetical protein